MTETKEDYTILFPVTKKGMAENVIRVASAVLSQHRGRIIGLGIVEIPEELSLSFGAIPAQRYRRFLESLATLGESQQVEMRTLVRVSRNTWEGVVETAKDEECDLIIIGWDGEVGDPNYFFGSTIDEVAKNAPSDLLIIKPGESLNYNRVLVPVRGGPHAHLALAIANAITRRFGSEIIVLHIMSPGADEGEIEHEQRLLENYLKKDMGIDVEAEIRTVLSDNIDETVAAFSEEAEVVVMGASLMKEAEGFPVSSVHRAVTEKTQATVIIAQTVEPVKTPLFEDEDAGFEALQPRQPRQSISDIVDKWFAENTFDADEFSDIEELIELKKKEDLTISLGLPTLNEGKTLGPIIESVKSELYDKHRLIDEIALIDSRSTDDTVAIAESYGVPVYYDDEILPAVGSLPGKGEALWKSLHVLEGDIIAWVDTDIRNIHPKFVYGIVGPLLKHPKLNYVKGFYRRPIKTEERIIETGGGRVTELTARPLLNLFFPELSGVVQPLSGEYAGRRSVLEKVEFYTGYGVEIGLLINLLEEFGLWGIGQVDLQKRIHRNQSLMDLSKMAFAIIQVVVQRLEEKHRVTLLQQINKSMKLIHHEPEKFYLELKSIQEQMRPPIITIPDYQGKFSSKQS